MVGFSGETYDDFEDIKYFIKEMNFEKCMCSHIQNDQGHAHIIILMKLMKLAKVQINELLQINEQNALKYRKQFVGTIQEVIIEK